VDRSPPGRCIPWTNAVASLSHDSCPIALGTLIDTYEATQASS